MCDKDNLDTLLKFIQECADKQTRELKQHIGKEIQELREEVKKERDRRIDLEDKYQELNRKYAQLEKSQRKNNIAIFGLENNTGNTLLDHTLNTLNTHLNLNISKQHVNNIYYIGKTKKTIIVKFVSFITKLEVLRTAKQLKGTNISIAEDLNIEERKRNKILRQHLSEARSRGLTAYIKNNKLYVNEEQYTAEELESNDDNSDQEDTENIRKSKSTENLQNPSLATVTKKRPNDGNDPNKQALPESDPKKRKVGSSTVSINHSQRSSPRFHPKENTPKSTTTN